MSVAQLKKDYNTRISETERKFTDHNHDKCITSSEFNNLITKSFAARLAQETLATKTDIVTKLTSLNRKIISNKTKHLLIENELKKTKNI